MYKRHFEKLGIKIGEYMFFLSVSKPKPDPGEPNQCGSRSVKLFCRSHYFAAVQIWLMCAYTCGCEGSDHSRRTAFLIFTAFFRISDCEQMCGNYSGDWSCEDCTQHQRLY
jgi:hypothetical protein